MVFLVLVPFKRFDKLQLYWWICLLKTISWGLLQPQTCQTDRQGMGDDDFDDDGDCCRVSGFWGPIFNLGYGYRFQRHHPNNHFPKEGITRFASGRFWFMCWKADVHFFGGWGRSTGAWLMFELILLVGGGFKHFWWFYPGSLRKWFNLTNLFQWVETIDQEGPPDDEDEEDLALEANEDGASKKSMMCVLTERIHVW